MLTLPIKRKWFDMIVSGKKLEEYRDVKPYYNSRLYKHLGQTIPVRFRNGYLRGSPTIECSCYIKDSTGGNPEWGAEPNKLYYVLHIIKIERVNVDE